MAIDRSVKGTVWNIQILRFIAAAMVLLAHLNTELAKFPAMAGDYVRFEPIWFPGGVDIFFIISGFIMYYISSDAFNRPGAPMDFIRRRFIRLVPPYWFFTTLTLIAMLVVPHYMTLNTVEPAQVIGSYLFVPALNGGGRPFPVLILGWTLEFEMLFYTIFAIGMRFRQRIGLVVIVGLIGAVAASNSLQPLPMPFGFWADTIVLEFLFGIGLAFAHRRGVRLRLIPAALVGAAGLAAWLWVQANNYPDAGWQTRFLWAGLPSLLVCAAVALVPEAATPGRFKKFLVLLGDSSYALYLSHPFVLGAVAWGVLHVGFARPWAYILIAGVACVAASVVFHLLLEKPVYAWLTRRYDVFVTARHEYQLAKAPAHNTTDGAVVLKRRNGDGDAR